MRDGRVPAPPQSEARLIATPRVLSLLEGTASTARVLNLWSVHKRRGAQLATARSPLFQDPVLDRAIILKHRLRPHELDLFENNRSVATKILVPIDREELRSGAHFAFVGERGFEAMLENVCGRVVDPESRDGKLLKMIDELPSLDPFLLRESISGISQPPCNDYFEISVADVRRMLAFAKAELTPIIALGGSSEGGVATTRVIESFLSPWPERAVGYLANSLGLNTVNCESGLRAWRAILYYKWLHSELEGKARSAVREITGMHRRCRCSSDVSEHIGLAQIAIRESVTRILAEVSAVLDRYNEGSGRLAEDGSASTFRDFLLSAPSEYLLLGDRLGGLDHMVSYWRYWREDQRSVSVDALMLADLLTGFVDVLTPPAPGGKRLVFVE